MGRLRQDWDVAAAVGAGLVLELVLLAVWQRNGYWDFSDGVYAESAREFLHGLVPYRDFAAAQPPLVFLVGVVLLAIHDGLASLRAGMALADLMTAILVGVCVWRLTGLRAVAVATAVLSPLLPISLHEHAQLTPETLAAPLLLGGALLCARRGRAGVGGVLLALAVLSKLAFALPALAIALSTRQRREATLSLILAS
jgi:alpha-1,2-mannosyltransferase